MGRLGLKATLRGLVKFARLEAERCRGRVRPDLLVRGFFSEKAGQYRMDRDNRDDYLTDWEIVTRVHRINPASGVAVLNDKLLFHLFLDRVGCPVPRPELAGVWMDGNFIPAGCFPSLESLRESRAELIAKPLRGAMGDGVALWRAGSEPVAGAMMLERRVEPHAYARAIFPDALNTVRLYTARDPDSGRPFILGAAHRFGVAASAPADNASRGGLVSSIDLATGRMSLAVGTDERNRRQEFPAHPETGGRIEGIAVPGWEEVKRAALTLADCVPSLRFIGWDLAVTPYGPVVIEGNAQVPGPVLLQMHGRPLLADPRARRFFHAVGVLSDARARSR